MRLIKKVFFEKKIKKYLKESNYLEVKKTYDALIGLYPKNSNYRFNKMQILVALGKLEEANIIADTLIKFHPQNHMYYLRKAAILDSLNKYEDAIEFYTKGIELDKNNIDAYTGKGIALACIKNYNDAIACYNKAIKIAPKKAYWAYCNKAVAYLIKDKNYNYSLELCDTAMKLKRYRNDFDYAYFVKSRAYALKGDEANCLNNLHEAIKLEDKWKNAIDDCSEFDSLRDNPDFIKLKCVNDIF